MICSLTRFARNNDILALGHGMIARRNEEVRPACASLC